MQKSEFHKSGNLSFENENYEKAIHFYELAFEEAKTDNLKALLKSNLAQCYMKLGQYKESFKCTSKSLELNPTNLKTLLRHAEAAIILNDDTSIDSARSTLKLCMQRSKDPKFRKEADALYQKLNQNASFPELFDAQIDLDTAEIIDLRDLIADFSKIYYDLFFELKDAHTFKVDCILRKISKNGKIWFLDKRKRYLPNPKYTFPSGTAKQATDVYWKLICYGHGVILSIGICLLIKELIFKYNQRIVFDEKWHIVNVTFLQVLVDSNSFINPVLIKPDGKKESFMYSCLVNGADTMFEPVGNDQDHIQTTTWLHCEDQEKNKKFLLLDLTGPQIDIFEYYKDFPLLIRASDGKEIKDLPQIKFKDRDADGNIIGNFDLKLLLYGLKRRESFDFLGEIIEPSISKVASKVVGRSINYKINF